MRNDFDDHVAEEPAAGRINRRDVLVGGALVLGSVLLSGYGGRRQSRLHGTFVGRVPGSDAFVGIDTYKDRLTTYVCDGKDGHISINEWFHAPVTSGAMAVRNAGGAELHLHAAGSRALGTLRLADGKQLSFVAHPLGKHEFFAHEKKHGRSIGSVIIDGESRGKAGEIPSGCWCQATYGTWYLYCNAHAPYVAGKC